MTAESQL